MKKQLLVLLAAASSVGANAQLVGNTNAPIKIETGERTSVISTTVAGGTLKTTGLSDTLHYLNNSTQQLFDTSRAYLLDMVAPVDSGYWFGYNLTGTNAYAEKFSFGFMPDTSFHIIGIRSLWSGTVQNASTKTIDFKIWKQGPNAPVTGFPDRLYQGFPSSVEKSQTVSIRNLGIGNANPDTIKNFYFSTPLTSVNYNFYVGYETNYNWASLGGDTITLRSTRNGFGNGTFSANINGSGDTVLLNRNVMRVGTTTWLDLAFDLGFDLNLSIVPIVQFSSNNINSVSGLVKNDLTFYGHYPNPAVNSTNIKVGLDKAADLTIQLTDVNGRVINTFTERLTSGTHLVKLNTEALAAGNYVYLVRSSNGGAIAAQITVAK